MMLQLPGGDSSAAAGTALLPPLRTCICGWGSTGVTPWGFGSVSPVELLGCSVLAPGACLGCLGCCAAADSVALSALTVSLVLLRSGKLLGWCQRQVKDSLGWILQHEPSAAQLCPGRAAGRACSALCSPGGFPAPRGSSLLSLLP